MYPLKNVRIVTILEKKKLFSNLLVAIWNKFSRGLLRMNDYICLVVFPKGIEEILNIYWIIKIFVILLSFGLL